VIEKYVYLQAIENGANLLTIAFSHATDALCSVLGEIKDISAILSNHRKEHQPVTVDGRLLEMVPKTSHDYVTMNGRLINGDGVVEITYAPDFSRTGQDFYWEIMGTEGTLVLEGPRAGGHLQMNQPTLKLFMEGEEMALVDVERSTGFSFNVGKAWDAWANGGNVITFEDALIRHKMIDAIYKSAESGTRQSYV
jgi:predicted dehydrogenase